MSTCDKLCLVAGGQFGGALLATEANGKPELGLSHQRGQLLSQALTRLNLLQRPAELIICELRKTTTLQRELRYIVAKVRQYELIAVRGSSLPVYRLVGFPTQ